MSQFYIFICDCFKAVQNRVIFANFVSNSNQQKLLNPNPGHPLLSPTSCSLIAFFGSWVSLRVRTNFQTLLARSCEVSSSVRGFQCMYVLYRAQMAFFHGLDSFKHITKLLRLSNFSMAKPRKERTTKILQKVENDGSAFLHDLNSFKHFTRLLGL